MPLDLNGPLAQQQIDHAETELTIEASKDGETASASVTVTHTAARWSVTGFGSWIRGKGWGAGGKATIKLGD